MRMHKLKALFPIFRETDTVMLENFDKNRH